ncbi:hypothetical protein BD410DRAFT_794158 [Rickenella mellea]|uniref:BTB domain-containing protein n=1 Tax=Rickenella mellea TaxID=50990 RepID=A0A4Y7PQH4_9AGAM|nr:hypothetical protein BD410DRAFT_794158 [Rickenella mellea]
MASSDSNSNERHASLYFPDGDIVLFARLKAADSGHTIFRVHRFMLSHHSVVFKDMFSLPPETTVETYDNAPLVHMRDAAEDLESLLSVLYNPAELLLKRHDSETPTKCRGLLELSIKYQIDPIRECIVAQIEDDWPMTLAQWDSMNSYVDLLIDQRDGGEDHFLEPAAAIQVAKACNIPRILPAAYYHLSRFYPSEEHFEDRGIFRLAKWELLVADDLMRLMKARDHLEGTMRWQPWRIPSPNCASSTICSKRATELWTEIRYQSQASRDPLDVLRDFLKENLNRSPFNEICDECSDLIEVRSKKLRETIWNDLGDTFYL